MDETDRQIETILRRTKVIALVGASAKPERPSHYVGEFLRSKGYRVIGINPGLAGQELYGEIVYASLSDIPASIPVDMVDIFRRSEQVGPVVDEALEVLPGLHTIWMQIGVTNEEAAERAQAKGIDVVQNRCPKAEYPRLIG
ncbi:CoA-binding protein [Qingshengfaniella alkalisoli]|uniref:CoA-binding protein n=1 Tax=Qingshengfaniella alkalisoli TaxID=2599296 RepID=A0A5B8ISU5_9RHOB|nr:CoA-binding protein [Qingshengfaniella alkalisoli]QDY68684.1 CoA-binding protein [Qingshengfaniella alkalisoli]